jgi:hypothetical protein
MHAKPYRIEISMTLRPCVFPILPVKDENAVQKKKMMKMLK